MSEYLKFLKSPNDEIILPFLDTIMRSAPDSILLGTAVLALLTQSWSYSVLLLFFIEIIGLHYVFGSAFTFISGSSGPSIPDKCGFMIPSYSQISILRKALHSAAFPIAPVFFMSSTIAYIAGSTMNMSNEINDLALSNPILRSRFPISITLSILFLTIFSLWRITNGCDSLLPSMGTIVLGFVTGGILLVANSSLFGRESINFTGLPLLADKISSGRPLYVCAQTEKKDVKCET
jgi:formate hydrogenlyase subunit 4